MSYPPAPWRIAGPPAIVPVLVPLAPARAHVDVPPASPFASLGLAGARRALTGHADFRLRAPRLLT